MQDKRGITDFDQGGSIQDAGQPSKNRTKGFDELDFKILLEMLWKKRKLISFFALTFLFIGVVLSYLVISPVYQTTLTFGLGHYRSETYANPAYVKQVVLGNDFLTRVSTEISKELKLSGFVISAENISVEPIKDTKLVKITVKDSNPRFAKAIVDKMFIVFKDISSGDYQKNEELLRNQMQAVDTDLAMVRQDIDRIRSAISLYDESNQLSLERELIRSRLAEYLWQDESTRQVLTKRKLDLEKEIDVLKKVELISGAELPRSPTKPQKATIIVSLAMLGLLAGIFWAYMEEFIDWPSLRRILNHRR